MHDVFITLKANPSDTRQVPIELCIVLQPNIIYINLRFNRNLSLTFG